MSVFSQDGGEDIPPRLRTLLHTIHFPTIYANSLFIAAGAARLMDNLRIYREVLAARGHYVFGIGRHGTAPMIGPEENLTGFQPAPVIAAFMKLMLAEAAAHGVTITFLPMPINEETARLMPREATQAFSAYLQQLSAAYPGFKVLGPVVTVLPDASFNDPLLHLNLEGARAFTTRLRGCRLTGLAEPVDTCLLGMGYHDKSAR